MDTSASGEKTSGHSKQPGLEFPFTVHTYQACLPHCPPSENSEFQRVHVKIILSVLIRYQSESGRDYPCVIVKMSPTKMSAIYVYKKERAVTMTKSPVFTCLVNLSAEQADFQNLTVTGHLTLSKYFLLTCNINH